MSRDVRRTWLLLNGVKQDRVEAVRERAADIKMEFLGCIPHDPILDEAVFKGESIYSIEGSPAISKMNEIMAMLGEN